MSDGIESYRREPEDRWAQCEKTIAFGDGDYLFKLPLKWIEELERQTGTTIGDLFVRTATYSFSVKEITEIIRCGLIGGGLDPTRARKLIETYIDGYPLEKMFGLASIILVGCVEGYPAKAPVKKKGEGAIVLPTVSISHSPSSNAPDTSATHPSKPEPSRSTSTDVSSTG